MRRPAGSTQLPSIGFLPVHSPAEPVVHIQLSTVGASPSSARAADGSQGRSAAPRAAIAVKGGACMAAVRHTRWLLAAIALALAHEVNLLPSRLKAAALHTLQLPRAAASVQRRTAKQQDCSGDAGKLAGPRRGAGPILGGAGAAGEPEQPDCPHAVAADAPHHGQLWCGTSLR